MAPEIVATRFGSLRGTREDDVIRFLGVRYAQAPTGSHRFRAPLAPEVASGTIDATEFGAIAPQAVFGLGASVPGDPQERDEDCLFLNLWTPACDDARRPVLFFVHGGAYVAGAGSSALYRGDHLARRGLVVVTCNYRLGALGFLAHRALEDHGALGNYGLLDQLAALDWVRDHIAGFGGDPENITAFGESAGAMSIGDLLGAARRPPFRRAILQSGSTSAVWPDAAAKIAEEVFRELGTAERSRDLLERVPIDELLAAQQAVTRRIDAGVGMPFRPVVDGVLLPEHPARAIAAGRAAAVELIVGTNRDEFKFFSATTPELAGLDEDGLAEYVGRYLSGGRVRGLQPASVIDAYRRARLARGETTDVRSLLDAFGSDWIFRVPALRLLEAQAAYNANCRSYLFEWPSPFANGALGACHGLELPFVFGTLVEPVVGVFAGTGPEADALCLALQEYWASFARDGAPTERSLGPWPRWDAATRATMVFGADTRVERAPMDEERTFWEAHLGRFGSPGSVEERRAHGSAWLARDETGG